MSQCSQGRSWRQACTARLTTHWRYKLVAGSLLAIGFNVIYFLVLHCPLFPVTEMPVTMLDDVIGFWATSLLIYMTLWIYISLGPWLLTDKRELVGHINAMAGLAFVGLAVFFLWPTSVPRPIIDLEVYPSFKHLVAIDEPRNVFPSLHAGFSIFSAICIERLLRRWGARTRFKVMNWCWCIAILYSALATKQHLAVDLFAGAALGGAWAWFYLRWLSGLQNMGAMSVSDDSFTDVVSVTTATSSERSDCLPRPKEV